MDETTTDAATYVARLQSSRAQYQRCPTLHDDEPQCQYVKQDHLYALVQAKDVTLSSTTFHDPETLSDVEPAGTSVSHNFVQIFWRRLGAEEFSLGP